MPSSRALVAETPEQRAFEESLLDGAAVLGQVARAVGPDSTRQRDGLLLQAVAGVDIDKLGGLAAAAKGDGANLVLHQLGKDVRGLGVRAAARRLLFVDERRVPQHEVLPAVGRAVVVDDLEGQPRQALGVLSRIRHRRRAQHKLRRAAVEGADAPQPTDDVRHVRPEDPAVDMALVETTRRSGARRRSASTPRGWGGCRGAACRGW